jgi:PAS domain S-box-containing protein
MDEAAHSPMDYVSTSTRYEQLFRAVFDGSALAIEITNMDGYIVACNPAYQELVGRPTKELTKMRYADVVHPDDADVDDSLYQSLLGGDRDDYVVEKRFVHKNGSTVHGNMHVSMIRDEENRPLYAMGTIVDFTELKRLEEFRHRFVADAAHELRGPVAALVGFSNILAERWEELRPEQVRSTVAALKRQGERLYRLTNALLDLSQVERDRGRIELSPVVLSDALWGLLESEPPPAGKTVLNEIPEGLSASAEIGRLEQVFRNLLTNAYRYGGEIITVRASEDEDSVTIGVADNGAGISPGDRDKLFDPFWRGHPGATEGTGLGLSIVSSLLRAMNGRITCEDAEPQGLRFLIVLERPQ